MTRGRSGLNQPYMLMCSSGLPQRHQFQPFQSTLPNQSRRPTRSRRPFQRRPRYSPRRHRRSHRSPEYLRCPDLQFPGLRCPRDHRRFLRNRCPHCHLFPELVAHPRRQFPRPLDQRRPMNLQSPRSQPHLPKRPSRRRHRSRRRPNHQSRCGRPSPRFRKCRRGPRHRFPLPLRFPSNRDAPRRIPKERSQRAPTTSPSNPPRPTILRPTSPRQNATQGSSCTLSRGVLMISLRSHTFSPRARLSVIDAARGVPAIAEFGAY